MDFKRFITFAAPLTLFVVGLMVVLSLQGGGGEPTAADQEIQLRMIIFEAKAFESSDLDVLEDGSVSKAHELLQESISEIFSGMLVTDETMGIARSVALLMDVYWEGPAVSFMAEKLPDGDPVKAALVAKDAETLDEPGIDAAADAAGVDPWVSLAWRAHLEETGLLTTTSSTETLAVRGDEYQGRLTVAILAFLVIGLGGLGLGIAFPFLFGKYGGYKLVPGPLEERGDGLTLYLVLLAWFAAFLALGMLTPSLVTGIMPGASPALVMSIQYLVLAAVGLGLISALALGKLRVGIRDAFFGPSAPGTKARHVILWGLLGFVAAAPFVILALLISTLFFGGDEPVSSPGLQLLIMSSAPWERILVLITAVVMAPLFEEILFRGFVYRVLKGRMGGWAAIVASSFLFSLVHVSMVSLLPIFLLGIFLAAVYEATGSLWTSILLHGLWNLANAGAVLVVFS